MRSGIRRALANLAVLMVTLAIGIAIVEIAGRRALPEQVHLVLADVDHRPQPDASAGINSDRIRSAIEAGDIPDDAFRVVVLGDSFVEGMYLSADQTIPVRLQELIRAREPSRPVFVLNFGWISSSPLLAERQLRDIGAKYRPDLVVHCLDMTDFHDDIRYRRLLDRDGIFALLGVVPVTLMLLQEAVAKIPPLHERLFGYPASRFFHSLQPLEYSRKYLEPLRRNVESIARFVREELGAKYALVVLPRSYQYSDRESPRSWEAGEYEPLGEYVLEPFRYFDEIRGGFDFPVYSLLADFQSTNVFPTCFPNDPHWNPAGARLAAASIHRRLHRDGQLAAVEGAGSERSPR